MESKRNGTMVQKVVLKGNCYTEVTEHSQSLIEKKYCAFNL